MSGLETVPDLIPAFFSCFQFEAESVFLESESADLNFGVVEAGEVGFESPVSELGGGLGNSVEDRGSAGELGEEPVGDGLAGFIKVALRRCKKFL